MTETPGALLTEPHQFDFWLGSWEVFGPAGRQVGTNTITAVCDGRVLLEQWSGAGDVEGRSLNSWDSARGRWHQTWMDSSGSTLLLDGGIREGAMVMEGSHPSDEDPKKIDLHRITWTPSPDGAEVRQHWQTSSDGGATWSTAFDGLYRRPAA
jgi:hypothetical protein